MKQKIIDKKEKLFGRWLEYLINTYPKESHKFFVQVEKQFTNPIGYTMQTELDKIYDVMADNCNIEDIKEPLGNIIRVRAVQDFPPSLALDFIPEMKEILSKESINDAKYIDFLDNMLLISFDLFMASREKLYEIKANEVRNRFGRVVDRLNQRYDERNENEKL